jgi:hypothetical protein
MSRVKDMVFADTEIPQTNEGAMLQDSYASSLSMSFDFFAKSREF